jgi:hypothetical protein
VTTNARPTRELADRLEVRTYPADLGPLAADGHHVARGWVARVPIAIEPTRPWDTGGMRYPLTVTTTYRLTGGPSQVVKARVAIEAQIWSAFYQMGMASMIMPMVCVAASIVRWRRTR